jgi:hypothetical protein
MWLALLSGMSAKAYDDLSDNPKLKQFKTETLMEFLKGIHYISLTALSVKDPLFFYIFVIANLLHHLTNEDGYKDPYEHSLLYSFLLVFLLIEPPTMQLEWMDCLLAVCACSSMWLEPFLSKYLLKNQEFSVLKLATRVGMLMGTSGWLYFAKSPSMKCLISYFVGYFIVSSMVQYYSVRLTSTSRLSKRFRPHGPHRPRRPKFLKSS